MTVIVKTRLKSYYLTETFKKTFVLSKTILQLIIPLSFMILIEDKVVIDNYFTTNLSSNNIIQCH